MAADLAGKNEFERVTLPRVGTIVDQEAEMPIAFGDGPGPGADDDGIEPVERDLAIISLADDPGQHALAGPRRRLGAKHAGTADIAAAQIEPVAF